MTDNTAMPSVATTADGGLHRTISWRGAFWIASGVPALVLFSIGSIAATIGTPSVLVWTVSVLFGLVQSMTYAEIAGMYPQKSGGASVYGAMAWLPYSKYVAPVSVWCNWLAWSPVLTIGASLAAGYVLTALFPADAAINTWSIPLLDLGFLKEDLAIRLNAQFLIGAAFLLLVFALQHHGILRAARVQTIVGIAVLAPLLLVGVVPLITGDVVSTSFAPFVPLSGAWDLSGWTLFAGGLFLAAWSAYAFETAVCYTRELKDPGRDTIKAIFSAGLVCLVVYTLVPFSFQGALGVDRLVTDAACAVRSCGHLAVARTLRVQLGADEAQLGGGGKPGLLDCVLDDQREAGVRHDLVDADAGVHRTQPHRVIRGLEVEHRQVGDHAA